MDTPVTPRWVSSYPPGLTARLTVEARSLVDAWRRRVETNGDRAAVAYFDGILTARRVDDCGARGIHVINELPKTQTGKIRRRVLQESPEMDET